MSTENIVTLFKNQFGNVQIALGSGTVVSFIEGKFFTTNAKLQKELQAAADNGNEFGVFVDATDASIDTNAATPIEQLRAKMRKELLAELEAGGKLINAGSYRPSEAQSQAAVGGTNTIVGAGKTDEELKEESNITDPENKTIQPTVTDSEKLSALEKLKAGQK